MLVDTVGEDRMAECMGYISLATVSGLLIAPVLGGAIYELGGYYSIFVAAFAFIALDTLLRFLVIERSCAAQWCGKDRLSSYGTFEASVTDHERNMPSEYSRRYSVDSTSLRPTLSYDTEFFANAESFLITAGDGPATSSFGTESSPLLMLLQSPRLLVALWGCCVQTLLLTSLEGVQVLFHNLYRRY